MRCFVSFSEGNRVKDGYRLLAFGVEARMMKPRQKQDDAPET